MKSQDESRATESERGSPEERNMVTGRASRIGQENLCSRLTSEMKLHWEEKRKIAQQSVTTMVTFQDIQKNILFFPPSTLSLG